MRNLWVVLFTAILFCGSFTSPFVDYRGEKSIIERIEIDFYALFDFGESEKCYVVVREDGTYVSNSGVIIDSDIIENLQESFTDFYHANEVEPGMMTFGYWPEFIITLTHTYGTVCLRSSSAERCFIPWNIEYDGKKFVQFNGKIPTALFPLLLSLDPDYWSHRTPDPQSGCRENPIPYEYKEQGVSPYFPATPDSLSKLKKKGISRLKWKHVLPDDGNHLPLLTDKNIYVTTEHEAFCFEIDSGKLVWKVHSEDKMKHSYEQSESYSAYMNENVYFTLTEGLMCVEGDSGKVLWKILYKDVSGPPIFTEDKIYVRMELLKPYLHPWHTLILCVDAHTGIILWEYEVQETWADGGHTVILHDDFIYYKSAEPSITCLDSNSGDIVWKISEDLGFIHIVLIDSNFLIYTKSGYKVRCLDRRTGRCLWEAFTYDNPIFEDILMGNRVLLHTDPDDTQISEALVDIAPGDVIWEGHMGTVRTSDPFVDDLHYFLDTDGKTLTALNVETGRELWIAEFDSHGDEIHVFEEGILILLLDPERPYPFDTSYSGLIFLNRDGCIAWEHRFDTAAHGKIHTPLPGGLFFFEKDGGITEAFNTETGEILWKVDLEGWEINDILFYEDEFYVSSDNGYIYCISMNEGKISWILESDSEVFYCWRLPPFLSLIEDGLLLAYTEDGHMFVISLDCIIC